MDYEKKYKEALERAKEQAIDGYLDAVAVNDIFPELRESDDEKIRKWIIGVLSTYEHDRDLRDAAIAWLEKQGEQPKKHDVCDTCDQQGSCVSPCPMKLVEKQSEQKLNVNDNAKEMFIKALECVEEQNNKGYKLTDCDKNSWWEDFKAYTSCIVEQKPWSEEDERNIKELLYLVEANYLSSEEPHDRLIKFLKSLRLQSQWKPSDAQMASITCAVRKMKESACYDSELVSLFNDLKKLKD